MDAVRVTTHANRNRNGIKVVLHYKNLPGLIVAQGTVAECEVQLAALKGMLSLDLRQEWDRVIPESTVQSEV